MDSEEQVRDRQLVLAAELKDIEYEIYQYKRRQEDLKAALARLDDTAPVHERERLNEQIGICETRLQANEARRDYVVRALKDASIAVDIESRYQRSQKLKKPKM